MKKRIALMGLWDIKNYGDPVLALCTKKLLMDSIPCSEDYDFVEVSLRPNFKISLIRRLLGAFCWRMASIIGLKNKMIIHISIRQAIDYYSRILKGFNAIVFVGGGIIKYKIEIFDFIIDAILKIAKLNKIPVVLNAVGIEGYDSTNERCLALKKYLNLPILKYISTRDDLQTLTKGYFDGNVFVPCKKVADPAVWAAECFDVRKDVSSNVVGIGVARGNIFKDYGSNFTAEDMADLYEKVINFFLSKGFSIELFTNGLNLDNDFLDIVMKRLSDTNVKKRIPSSARNLVEIIASYKAIVTTRMHAGIIAYSLDVPAIGLVWNDKIKFFWESAGHPEYCIDVAHLNPEDIFSALRNAIKNGYNQEHKRVFRQTIKDEIAKFATMLFQ